MIIASGLGAAVALTGWKVPELLLKPVDMLAGGAVPMVLLAFGLSLAGKAPLQKGDGRTESLVATFLKIAGMPVIVWALGRFVFGLEGQHLLAIVIMGALPTAQNVFLFASPYRPRRDRCPGRHPVHHPALRRLFAGHRLAAWLTEAKHFSRHLLYK